MERQVALAKYNKKTRALWQQKPLKPKLASRRISKEKKISPEERLWQCKVTNIPTSWMTSSNPYRYLATNYPMKLFIGEPATFKLDLDFEDASLRVVLRDPEWRVRSFWWLCHDPFIMDLIDEDTA